jgi:RNA polymerase sigma-70 factor (ECF subfamily)
MTAPSTTTDAVCRPESRADRLADAEIRALYQEHGGLLLRYVARLIGDRQRAEDIVQETMLRAWRHPEASTGRRSMRPWLITVARNLVVDNARARQSRVAEASGAHLELASVQDGLESMLLADAVRAAIRDLSPPQREVLVETYYRERTVAEAAAILGVPIGTVKSRTYYALRALRLALAAQGMPYAAWPTHPDASIRAAPARAPTG